MEVLTVSKSTLTTAAKNRGFRPAEYIARLASICRGREVCAHVRRSRGDNADFILLDSVRTHATRRRAGKGEA
jgi:predicted amidophosphoribosyltransferase